MKMQIKVKHRLKLSMISYLIPYRLFPRGACYTFRADSKICYKSQILSQQSRWPSIIFSFLILVFAVVTSSAESSNGGERLRMEFTSDNNGDKQDINNPSYDLNLRVFFGVVCISCQTLQESTTAPINLNFNDKELLWLRTMDIQKERVDDFEENSSSKFHFAEMLKNKTEEFNLVIFEIDKDEVLSYAASCSVVPLTQHHTLSSESAAFILGTASTQDYVASEICFLTFKQFESLKRLSTDQVLIKLEEMRPMIPCQAGQEVVFISHLDSLQVIKIDNDSQSIEYSLQEKNSTFMPVPFKAKCLLLTHQKSNFEQEFVVFGWSNKTSKEQLTLKQALRGKRTEEIDDSANVTSFILGVQASNPDKSLGASIYPFLRKEDTEDYLFIADYSDHQFKQYLISGDQKTSASSKVFFGLKQDSKMLGINATSDNKTLQTFFIIKRQSIVHHFSLISLKLISLKNLTLIEHETVFKHFILNQTITLKQMTDTSFFYFDGLKSIQSDISNSPTNEGKRIPRLLASGEFIEQSRNLFGRQLQSYPAVLVDQYVPYFIQKTYTVKILPSPSNPITSMHTFEATQGYSLPSFIQFIYDPTFKAPQYQILATSYPQASISVTLCIHQGSPYLRRNFTINFVETAPYFKQLMADIKITMGTTAQQTVYPLDKEGNIVTVTIKIDGSSVLSPLATFDTKTNTISFSPTLDSQLGSHTVDVTLSDGMMTNFDTFVVTVIPLNVVMTPPEFKSYPLNQIVQLNSYLMYQLPEIQDAENNFNTLTVESPTASSFMTLTLANRTLQFYPQDFSSVMIHTLIITITDKTSLATRYKISLEVTNTAPKFDVNELPDLTIYHNKTYFFSLPKSSDLEGNPIFVVQITSFPWIKSLSTSGFSVFTDNFSMIGQHVVILEVQDGQPLGTQYSFTVEILNRPPVFTGSLPVDQIIKLNQIKSYLLPPYNDPEGNPVTVSLKENTKALTFIKVEADQQTLTFYPQQFQLIGTHIIEVILEDPQPLQFSYKFIVNVTNTPPRFVITQPKNQIVPFNNIKQYNLPLFIDDEGDNVEIKVIKKPLFATLVDRKFLFSPDQVSHMGQHEIYGQLKDKISYTEFRFNVTVVNSPPYFEKILENQTAIVGTKTFYVLPKTGDKENLQVKVKPLYNGSEILPKYVKFDGYKFVISPLPEHVNDHVRINVVLIDSLDSANYNYYFNIDVANASQFQNVLTGQNSINQKVIIARIALLKATADGFLKFKLKSKEGDVGLLIQKITTKSFRLTIPEWNSTEVKYSIHSREQSDSSIVLKLQYQNSKNISATQDLDYLELYTLDDTIFSGTKNIQILPQGLVYQTPIPPQISEKNALIVEKFQVSSQIMSLVLIPGSLFLNLCLQECINQWFSEYRQMFIQYLWNFLNDISFLIVLSLISFVIPGIAQQIQSGLLSIIYLDILQTDKWLIPIIYNDNDDEEDDTALNYFFDQNGFKSKSLINNLGSTFVYGIAVFLFLFLLLVIKFMRTFFIRQQISDKLTNIAVNAFLTSFQNISYGMQHSDSYYSSSPHSLPQP